MTDRLAEIKRRTISDPAWDASDIAWLISELEAERADHETALACYEGEGKIRDKLERDLKQARERIAELETQISKLPLTERVFFEALAEVKALRTQLDGRWSSNKVALT